MSYIDIKQKNKNGNPIILGVSINSFINQIHCANCVDFLANLPNNCIDLTVTSPPYDNDKLRQYRGFPDLNCSEIARLLYVATKPGGVCVWVVGDATVKGGKTGTSFRHALTFQENGWRIHDHMIYEKCSSPFPARRNGNRYTQSFENMFVFSKSAPKTVNLICDKPNKWAGRPVGAKGSTA